MNGVNVSIDSSSCLKKTFLVQAIWYVIKRVGPSKKGNKVRYALWGYFARWSRIYVYSIDPTLFINTIGILYLDGIHNSLHVA